jgi:hypothetical protein
MQPSSLNQQKLIYICAHFKKDHHVARRNILSCIGKGVDDNKTLNESQEAKDWVMCGAPIEGYDIGQETV